MANVLKIGDIVNITGVVSTAQDYAWLRTMAQGYTAVHDRGFTATSLMNRRSLPLAHTGVIKAFQTDEFLEKRACILEFSGRAISRMEVIFFEEELTKVETPNGLKDLIAWLIP